MAFDLYFDPKTKDLVRDGKGSWQLTETAATMVLHQLWCHYNEWWGDSTLGSRLWNLGNFQRNPEVMVADEVSRSLGVIVGRGRIANLKGRAELEKPGRVVSIATFQDVATGQVIDTFAKAGGG